MVEVETARVIEPMTPNTLVENTSPGTKRKAGEEDVKGKGKAELDDNEEKKAKVEGPASSAPLVELRGRKMVYKQSPAPKIAPTRKRMLLFETLLVNAEEEGRKVTEIPEDNWDVIALAGNESTARTETLLVKQVKAALKLDDDKDLLPNDTITSLIPKLFSLQDYGFIPTDFAAQTSSPKIPVTLQIRCWEVKDLDRFFTPEQREVIQQRRSERQRAREECLKILEGLDDIEKLELIKGEKGDKGKKEAEPKRDLELNAAESSTPKATDVSPKVELKRKSREGTANTTESRRSMSPSKKSKMTPEEEEAARARKAEQEARRAQRAEKKAAQEREEEKKLAAKAKQAQAMSMFFKQKAPVSPVVSRESTAGPSSARQDSPVKLSEYQRTFRPIQRRANVRWAEINNWAKPRSTSRSPPKSKVKTDREEDSSARSDAPDVKGWQTSDFLRDHLRKYRLHGRASSRPPQGLKTAPLAGPVSDVIVAYQEAEDPRQVLAQLQDRSRFPWKVLAFDQQARPPYCGTFTKRSATVGPRTPFAQDPIFDYSYDSGDDWQDDEGGEDVDDFGEGQEPDDEEAEDESAGEFDDWLDDTEDVPYAPMDVDEEIIPLAGPTIEQSKLPMKVVKKSQAPRKIVKVTPTWKGPLWENRLGEGNEGMEGYRLQFLNETPDMIDPFQYTSLEAEQTYKTTYTTITIGMNLSVKCLLSTEFVVAKPVSDHVPIATTEITNAVETGGVPRGRTTVPKIAFPPDRLPELLKLVNGNTKIQSDLVSQLRAHFDTDVSKAAIEAKVREVAVREGKAKDSQWKVRPEAWAACGITPNGLNSPGRSKPIDSSGF